MINKLKKVKFKDLLGFIVLLFAIPLSLIVKIKNRKMPVWLICELKDMARDNGYHFFKYVRKNHPEINCYYAIDKKCSDYEKIRHFGNIIQFGSLKHWIYYLSSEYNISSHKEGNPNHTVFTFIHLYLHLLNNRVFLQHGIIKDDAPMFYYKNTYFKYFICGAKPEYEYIKNTYGYPKENLLYTGLARFDNLHINDIDKKRILVIPTWRRWFEQSTNIEKFKKSNYFKNWYTLLSDSELNKFLEKNDIKLIFYPHYAIKKFIHAFNLNNKNIEIVKENSIDIQTLLKSSSLMITDYSSVFMDFAYMKKPIIYFQFDYEEYRKSHFKKGYFDYKKDGFGPVTDNCKETINIIKEIYKNDYKVEQKYLKRMETFFELNDDKNSERIFKTLIERK